MSLDRFYFHFGKEKELIEESVLMSYEENCQFFQNSEKMTGGKIHVIIAKKLHCLRLKVTCWLAGETQIGLLLLISVGLPAVKVD